MNDDARRMASEIAKIGSEKHITSKGDRQAAPRTWRVESMRPATEEDTRGFIERAIAGHIARACFPVRQMARAEGREYTNKAWIDAAGRLGASLGRGGVYAIVGRVGTGKTQMVVSVGLAFAKKSKSVKYVLGESLIDAFRETFGDNATRSERALMADMTTCDLLILDEADKIVRTEFGESKLHTVIDRRYADMRDTIICTNVTKENLLRAFGAPIESRIAESGGAFDLDWASFRTGGSQ